MQKKQKQGIAPFINFTSLTAGLLLLLCLPLNVKANHGGAACYKLGTLTIVSTGAVAPTTKPYPYLRFIKWLTPTTHPSCIHSQINLTPGTIFDAKTLLSIKKRLMALPYFSTVSITRKVVDPTDEIMLSDLIIETKDRFPITFDVNLDRGALFTITHHNAWGRGHSLSQQLFLKKKWGYGLAYELPKLDGNYFFGGAYYTQIGDGYRFKYQNLWVSKSFKMQTEDPYAPYYWTAGLSGSRKNFVTPTPIIYLDNSPYHSHTFLLAKVGWVADSYETMRGIYTLNALEQLPKGGAVEMFYGYQKRQSNNRHYIGLNGIKNIANTALRHLHISCESSAFVHKKRLEEGILKLALAYAGTPIQSCNGARQFVAIDYIIGWRMPKERMLGITHRDPEALEKPSDENSLPLPIGARLNVHLDSTLHRPIVTNLIRFVFLGFTNFIALYSKNHQLLNQTWVDSCGIGLQLEHITKPWPTLTLKVGHSALLGRVIPSVQLSTGHFKNKTEAKPTLVDYS